MSESTRRSVLRTLLAAPAAAWAAISGWRDAMVPQDEIGAPGAAEELVDLVVGYDYDSERDETVAVYMVRDPSGRWMVVAEETLPGRWIVSFDPSGRVDG